MKVFSVDSCRLVDIKYPRNFSGFVKIGKIKWRYRFITYWELSCQSF